jgi:tRNA(Leu) C34 or U34 (ribose-2'-O)-methylase TrmL
MNVRDEFKNNSVEQNQAIARESAKNFAVATFNLKGDLNLGTIMRTAHLAGAEKFFIFGHRGWDRRSAVGVQNYIDYEKHDEVKSYSDVNQVLCTQNPDGTWKRYRPVVVEQGGEDLFDWLNTFHGLEEFNKSKGIKMVPPCFIFGPEEGFPSDWPADIELKQLGVSRSYNVSSAAAIVLYNWSFYDSR